MQETLAMSMERVPMTTEGYQQLEAELHRLKSEERPRIIQAIAEARAHGDLSENAEYHSAKEAQGMNEARHVLPAGVEFYWPGLQYHYEGRRLVGVEGEFVSSAHAMSSLVEHFRGCFGDPRYRTTWRDAPEDSDVYRRRLVSYGWHDRQTTRNLPYPSRS